MKRNRHTLRARQRSCSPKKKIPEYIVKQAQMDRVHKEIMEELKSHPALAPFFAFADSVSNIFSGIRLGSLM